MPAVQLWCIWTGSLCGRHNLFPPPCSSMHYELMGLTLAPDFTLLQIQADSHESAIALGHPKALGNSTAVSRTLRQAGHN